MAADPLTPAGPTGIDPVCGMTVERSTAQTRGLTSEYHGIEYVFCGRGCKLDFDDEPERFIGPDHMSPG